MLILKFNAGSVDKKIRVIREGDKNDFVVVSCDCTDGSFSVYFEDARMYKNMIIIINKSDATANTLTLYPSPGQLIGGEEYKVLTALNQGAIIVSDGQNLL